MSADTVSIDEVVILPRLANLKSDIFNPRSEKSSKNQNASNNLELSAYQAKMNQNNLVTLLLIMRCSDRDRRMMHIRKVRFHLTG